MQNLTSVLPEMKGVINHKSAVFTGKNQAFGGCPDDPSAYGTVIANTVVAN